MSARILRQPHVFAAAILLALSPMPAAAQGSDLARFEGVRVRLTFSRCPTCHSLIEIDRDAVRFSGGSMAEQVYRVGPNEFPTRRSTLRVDGNDLVWRVAYRNAGAQPPDTRLTIRGSSCTYRGPQGPATCELLAGPSSR